MSYDAQSSPTFVTLVWLRQGGGRQWGMSMRKLNNNKRLISECGPRKRAGVTYLNAISTSPAAEVGAQTQ